MTTTLEPTWEIAHLFPPQGAWTEAEYLALDTNQLAEFTAGMVEVLPVPALSHQFILTYLFELFSAFVRTHDLGMAMFATTKLKVRHDKIREPDMLFVTKRHLQRREKQYWLTADLVLEVVSPDSPERDTVQKRWEYAEAGIPEYWIVDPRDNTISVLVLQEGGYVAHTYGEGETAASELLQGFTAEVTTVFAQAEL